MATPYAKPFKSIPEQIALLRERGLLISDSDKAALCLQRLGYYRLSGYLYPFRKRKIEKDAQGKKAVTVFDQFQDGTDLGKVMELYVFDKSLRSLVLDAIERVEVALRVDIALMLGERSPTAHRESAHVHGNFTRVNPPTGKSGHQLWLERLDEVVNDSKEEFVKHFKRRYLPPLPIWVAIETWDFGLLSVFLGGMRHDDLLKLCTKYGIARPSLLQSWIRCLNHIRNICAHHCRLWNRALVDNPGRPVYGEMPLHNHWIVNEHSCTRIYCGLAILAHLLRYLHPTSSWPEKIKDHLGTFPDLKNENVSLNNAGFPHGWQAMLLWQGSKLVARDR
jgi:abortive infection bacteriophage resistance protein